jgi:hypothetical protein
VTEGTSRAQAQRSTALVAAVLSLIGAWQWYRGREAAMTVLGVLAVLTVVLAAIPAAALWFNRGWMRLAVMLAYVNTRILLTVFYYVCITPIGWIARVLGHDGLARRGPKAPSYWHPRSKTRQSKEDFERAY